MTTMTAIDRERLFQLMETSGHKQGSLAKAAGISRTYLNEILSGKKQPSKPVIAALVSALNATGRVGTITPADLGVDAIYREGTWKT